jgi:lipoate-protein ligase B
MIDLVDYRKALDLQRRAVGALRAGRGGEIVFLLSHPPTITLGRKGRAGNVLVPAGRLEAMGIVLVRVERGGDATFHGPGQLVAYPILDLGARRVAPPRHVGNLEEAMLGTMRRLGVEGTRVEGLRGVFIRGAGGRLLKAGAVGVAVAAGISSHGLALNVEIDPQPFDLIVPCGLPGVGVTSLHLHAPAPLSIDEAADILAGELRRIYGGDLAIRTAF